MHIAYLHHLDREDTARNHVRQFSEAARRLGHRVDVHSIEAWGRTELSARSLQSSKRALQALRSRLARYLHEPWQLLRNAAYLQRELGLLGAARPDVLIVRDHFLEVSSVLVARRLGLPLVVETNGPAAEARLYVDRYVHLPLVPEWLQSWKLRRADRVTTVSSALKRYLVDRLKVPEDRLTVVPNGADVEAFRPDTPCDPQVPADFERAPVVGFVGSFLKFHGPELLARLTIEIGALRPDVRFLFVGDGPEAEGVRQRTASLGDRVLFLGHVPHTRVPGLVATIDIGVLPDTAFYCSPLKVMEWMAAGKAVVAPRYSALEEVIQDGVEGVLFPPGDADALIHSVLHLLDHPEQRVALGRAATSRARTTLTWNDNARRVMAVCMEAIDAHRPRTREISPPGSVG